MNSFTIKSLALIAAALASVFWFAFDAGTSCGAPGGKQMQWAWCQVTVRVDGLKSTISDLRPASRSHDTNVAVRVQLDDGSTVPGDLTPKATNGRIVEKNDIVLLDCKNGIAINGPDGTMIESGCQLNYTRLDRNSMAYPVGHPLHGIQPGFPVNLTKDGHVRGDLLVLSKPIPAADLVPHP